MGQERVEGYAEGFRIGWNKSEDIFNGIIEKVENELCTKDPAYEEFERAVKITCNHIRLELRDVKCVDCAHGGKDERNQI
jgi:hypothetical protein